MDIRFTDVVVRCNMLPDVWEFAVPSSTLDNDFALLSREYGPCY